MMLPGFVPGVPRLTTVTPLIVEVAERVASFEQVEPVTAKLKILLFSV